MLKVDNVNTFYGRIQALKEVSLRVESGEIVALIGANGAGKTTLLNTISGVVPARSGEITLDGRGITRLSAEAIVRAGISHVPERRQIFGTLSVQDNLLLGAYSRAIPPRIGGRGARGRAAIHEDLEHVYDLFPVLKERAGQLGGTLSGGEQQMLAVGRGLMARPKLLLLDEPSLGLAPLLVREIFEIIADLRREGTTILLVEQNAYAALRVADRIYVMETGKVVMEGSAAELAADDDIQRHYLGRRNARGRGEGDGSG